MEYGAKHYNTRHIIVYFSKHDTNCTIIYCTVLYYTINTNATVLLTINTVPDIIKATGSRAVGIVGNDAAY